MISFLFMLLMGNPLTGLLSHPPQDLASLLEPAAVLQKLDVKTTEDALLDVLKTKADAAAADADGGDVLYVKKLMAIRLLAQNKSQNALPALQEVAKGSDITLRDAAQEAIAALSGKASPRPSGAALLKEIARSLPADAGFVAVLDMERDSKATTFGAFMETAMKEMEAKGLVNAFTGNTLTPEQTAQMKAQMNARFHEMTGQAEDGIIHALAQTGNVRIDAAAVVFSRDIGLEGGQGYVGYLFKGLYDPERIAKALKNAGPYEERNIAGAKVFVTDHGPQICLYNANTLMAVTPFLGTETVHIEKMLAALTAAEMKAPSAVLTTAFDLVTEKKARLAASGAFSQAQKDRIRAWLGENPTGEPVDAAMRQVVLNFVQADSCNAVFDAQGKFALQAVCADNAAAATLGDAAKALQQMLQDQIAAAPPQMRTMFGDGAFWQTTVAEKTVTMKADNPLTLVMIPMFFARAARPVQPIQPMPPPPGFAPMPR